MTDQQLLANALAYLWCQRRYSECGALVRTGRRLFGHDWWCSYFSDELRASVRKAVKEGA